MRPYQEQFRRVVRCLNKIEKETGDRVEYEDDLWTFFQNCWHLKDWIKYDPTLRGRAIRKEIEKKVKHTKYLEICADIANRRKHSTLRPRPHQKRASRKNAKVRADSSGLQDAIKLAFSEHKGEWLTASNVRDCLVEMGFDLRHYQANPLASIGTTLKRMTPAYLDSKISESGPTLYRRRQTLIDEIGDAAKLADGAKFRLPKK